LFAPFPVAFVKAGVAKEEADKQIKRWEEEQRKRYAA